MKIAKEDQYLETKKWGLEIWPINCDEFCGKLLIFKKGGATSMHLHRKKKETMYCQSGKLMVKWSLSEDCSTEIFEAVLEPGDSFNIERNQIHQLIALEDTTLVEFSTHHENEDSYRLWPGWPPENNKNA